MRVAHVSAGSMFGGVETMLLTLAKCQDLYGELKHQFALLFDAELAKRLRNVGAHVDVLGDVRLRRPLSVFRARRELARVLDRQSVDVVIFHGCWSLAVLGPVPRRRATPSVLWFHDQPVPTLINNLAMRNQPQLAITNSAFVDQTFSTLYPSTPSCLLHYPVVLEPRAESVGEQESLRNALLQQVGASPDAALILMAARMEPWKGHELLLDGIAQLHTQNEWVCLVAGAAQRPHEEEFFAKLLQQAERLGIDSKVHFLGFRKDIPQLMAASDIYCQPNLGPEPFGISFIEALNAGLPVVSTNMGGAAEIVSDSCGILIPRGDAAALASALGELVDAPQRRKQLGSQGIQRARELCTPGAQLKKLHNALTRVIPTNRQAA